jgi:hypothetical protein
MTSSHISNKQAYGFICMRSQVLTMVTMKITVFWDVMSCSLVDIYECLRGTFCPIFNVEVFYHNIVNALQPTQRRIPEDGKLQSVCLLTIITS